MDFKKTILYRHSKNQRNTYYKYEKQGVASEDRASTVSILDSKYSTE